jgi:hypothetical protein
MAEQTGPPRRGFDPGPWGSGGFIEAHSRRYRMWHVRVAGRMDLALPPELGDGAALAMHSNRLIDVAWGIMICDRVSPRGTQHILDHVPQLRVATY